jgi:fructokinase
MSKTRSEEPILIAAVEGGGTSFVVAVAEIPSLISILTTDTKILYREEIDSSHDNPQQTLKECSAFFEKYKPSLGYHALGIAMFGPVGLDCLKPETYGHILKSSPKAQWRNVDFLTALVQVCRGSLPLAIKIDTDVNAPAFAEYMLEKKKNTDISSLSYFTVGKGIGVGLVVNGSAVHGRMHPEGKNFKSLLPV